MAGQASSDEGQDRRRTPRYKSRSAATVIREEDMMRTGVPAVLQDVATGGLRLRTVAALATAEQIKIVLKNELQRFEREVRGIVRRVEPLENGEYSAGVELYTRLTPQELTLIRQNIITAGDADDSFWV